jgi:hypothetical protein
VLFAVNGGQRGVQPQEQVALEMLNK